MALQNQTGFETFGYCGLCNQIVQNPCILDELPEFEGLLPTPQLIPAPVKVIRAEAHAVYQTRIFACKIGRYLHRLKISDRETANFVAYKISEGLSQGIRYETPWGRRIEFHPETIDEMFDGRKTLVRSADTNDWNDEVTRSDRAFGYLKERAIKGRLGTMPDRRWITKFMLIDMARRTPSSDVIVCD